MSRTVQRVTMRRHRARARQRTRASRRSGGRNLAGFALGFLGLGGMALALSVLTFISSVGVLSADLPEPSRLGALRFAQPTVVVDRDDAVELGRFERERRRVVGYEEIPDSVLDATTSAEDRTFWENAGVDLPALVSAIAENASGERERGASTITQQLVRARLLPADAVAPGSDRYLRKVKEIVQSLRVTATLPGVEGKRQIITAYLNEIFYGHDAYGIAAAAQIYFKQELADLTVAQAALLAALPKSPTTLDPFRYAEADADGRLVVPAGALPVVRRDWVLRGMATAGRFSRLTRTELAAALAEPVVLAPETTPTVRGGHFTWQVRRQLNAILGADVDLATGGYRVVTTLDMRAQRLAEKWLAATVIAPGLSKRASTGMLDGLKVPKSDRGWIAALRGKDLNNGSLVAIDYTTGDVLAYVGSAGYARNDLASARFDPKFDAAGDGARQPGSAFKPILYAAAFDARRLSPGSLLLDVTTEFDRRADWAPRDADRLDRGPVLVRRALQYSLNVPAVRALERVGSEQVADTAAALGISFAGGRDAFLQAGLAGALGTVEVTPFDLTTAYASIGNGGIRVSPRMILEIRGPDGAVIWRPPSAQGERAVSAQAAFMVADILQGNTDPKVNPIWAEKLELRNGPAARRRPAAVKTGTTNEARDLGTYGFLPPQPSGGPGLAVGIWLGNSDNSRPRASKPATSLTAAAPMWRAFVRDLTRDWPVTSFERPSGLVSSRIDAWSGGAPGPWTRDTIKEWFIKGTEPGRAKAIDEDGLLYRPACGGWRVDPVGAELGPSVWRTDVADWLQRARRGTGVGGRYGSRTAYFWGERSWGGALLGPCQRRAERPPRPRPVPDTPGGDGPGGEALPVDPTAAPPTPSDPPPAED